MNCPNCQSPLSEGAAFCSLCGLQFGAAPEPAQLPGGAAAAIGPPATIEAILARDYEVKIGDWISRAFTITKANFGPLILGYLITVLVISAVPMGGLIIRGPMMAGMMVHYFRILKGQPSDLGILFRGFQRFLPFFLVILVSGLMVFAGVLLCVLPAIYLAVGYRFALLLSADHDLDFWPALETSRKLVHKHWFGWFLFGLALFGINMLGVLACFVGLLFTVPLSIMATVIAYDDVVGIRRTEFAPASLAVTAA